MLTLNKASGNIEIDFDSGASSPTIKVSAGTIDNNGEVVGQQRLAWYVDVTASFREVQVLEGVFLSAYFIDTPEEDFGSVTTVTANSVHYAYASDIANSFIVSNPQSASAQFILDTYSGWYEGSEIRVGAVSSPITVSISRGSVTVYQNNSNTTIFQSSTRGNAVLCINGFQTN